jgi:hypothetical protein
MTMFGKGNKAECIKVTGVSMLGTKKKIGWERRDKGLIVGTPSVKTDDMAIVFKIRTSG